MAWLADGGKTLKICLLVSTNVTDRQTDGQTDTARHKRMAFAVEDFRKKPHVKLDL